MKKTSKRSNKLPTTKKVPENFEPQVIDETDSAENPSIVITSARPPQKKVQKTAVKSSPTTGKGGPWKLQIIEMNETEPYDRVSGRSRQTEFKSTPAEEGRAGCTRIVEEYEGKHRF